MGFQFEVLADTFQLQIKLDRVVSAGAHGDVFPAGNRDGSEVSVCRWVNGKAINAALFERLTAQVKRRRVEIEQVSEMKVARRCFSGRTFAFRSCSRDSAIGESHMGSDFL